MGSKKHELEIIFTLQWKNKSSGGDDKTTVVGMYDTPTTTLKWELFKKYLLKNSGTTGNDIKVSYFTADEVEVPIETETDFQIAMYTFRKEARKGALINLLLERVSGAKPKRVFGPLQENKQCTSCANDEAPNWFKKYMKQMKYDITQEVTVAVLNAIGYSKLQGNNALYCQHPRKSKSDSKKTRKAWLIGEGPNDKDIRKSLRFEHKLEHKLEKLERKTLKLKEKKISATRSSDSDSGAPLLSNLIEVITSPNDETEGMDAALANQFDRSIVPHLMGGEAYMQQWEVINTGKLPWTEDTEVRYAWGSKPLSPVRKIVSCPKLNPGEKGPVCVLLDVPEPPGSYECHWYFYNKGKRFGCSLDCELIVDPSPVKRKSLESTISPRPSNSQPLFVYDNDLETKKEEKVHYTDLIANIMEVKIDWDKFAVKEKEELKCSSDSDNQSIISIADSNASNRSGPWSEFVMVSDADTQVKKESEGELEAENDANNNAKVEVVKECPVKDVPLDLSQNVVVEEAVAAEETKDNTGYAYVMLNGKKIAVPKKFLHQDYLQTAEDAPEPIQTSEKPQPDPVDLLPNEPPQKEAYESVKSDQVQSSFDATGRLFVFPQNCPGFEVVHPQIESMTASINFESSPFASALTPPTENQRTSSSCYGFTNLTGSSVKYNPYGPLDDERKGEFTHSTPPSTPTTQPASQASSVNFGQQFEQQKTEQPKTEPQPQQQQPTVHMLPDNIVTSAVNVASSAINTARTVLNMIKPQKPEESGKFLNGHWVTTNPDSKRECDLRLLEEMGFMNRDYNATLLNRFEDDMDKVIFELLK